MSGAAHTPGPWVVDGPDMFGDFNIVLANRESDSRAIAAVVSNLRDPAEVAANACLNAAAPELLEALDWALAEIEGRTRYDTTCPYNADEQRDNCLTLARAAIAKARGEA